MALRAQDFQAGFFHTAVLAVEIILTLLWALLVIPFAVLFNAKVAWMLWDCLLLLVLMGVRFTGWLACR